MGAGFGNTVLESIHEKLIHGFHTPSSRRVFVTAPLRVDAGLFPAPFTSNKTGAVGAKLARDVVSQSTAGT